MESLEILFLGVFLLGTGVGIAIALMADKIYRD